MSLPPLSFSVFLPRVGECCFPVGWRDCASVGLRRAAPLHHWTKGAGRQANVVFDVDD